VGKEAGEQIRCTPVVSAMADVESKKRCALHSWGKQTKGPPLKDEWEKRENGVATGVAVADVRRTRAWGVTPSVRRVQRLERGRCT